MKLKKCLFCLVLVVMCVFCFSLFSVKTNAISSVPTNQYLGKVDVPLESIELFDNYILNTSIDYGITNINSNNYYIGSTSTVYNNDFVVYYLNDFENNIKDSYFYSNMEFTSGWDIPNSFVLALYGNISFYQGSNSYSYDLYVNSNDVSILFGYSLPSQYITGDISFTSYSNLDSIEFVEDSLSITFFTSDGFIYTISDSLRLIFNIIEVYGDLDSFNNFVESFYVGSTYFFYSDPITSPFSLALFNSLIYWSNSFTDFVVDSSSNISIYCMINDFWISTLYTPNYFEGLFTGSPYISSTQYGGEYFSTISYYLVKSILNYEIVGTTSEQLKEQEIYYNQVIKDVEEQFYDKGFEAGKNEGFGTGYDYGYNIGYGNGIQEGSDGEFKLRTLLGAIFSFPLSVLTTGLNVELWGINVGNLLMFVFFTVLGYVLIKLILKFFGR